MHRRNAFRPPVFRFACKREDGVAARLPLARTGWSSQSRSVRPPPEGFLACGARFPRRARVFCAGTVSSTTVRPFAGSPASARAVVRLAVRGGAGAFASAPHHLPRQCCPLAGAGGSSRPRPPPFSLGRKAVRGRKLTAPARSRGSHARKGEPSKNNLRVESLVGCAGANGGGGPPPMLLVPKRPCQGEGKREGRGGERTT